MNIINHSPGQVAARVIRLYVLWVCLEEGSLLKNSPVTRNLGCFNWKLNMMDNPFRADRFPSTEHLETASF